TASILALYGLRNRCVTVASARGPSTRIATSVCSSGTSTILPSRRVTRWPSVSGARSAAATRGAASPGAWADSAQTSTGNHSACFMALLAHRAGAAPMAIAFREPPLRQWRARTVSRVLQTLHGGPRRTPARNYRVAGAAVTGEAAAVPSVSARRALLGVLVAAFVAGTAWAYWTGRVSPGSIDEWLESLGPAAPALFVGAFALGAMVGLPGIV